MAKMCPFCNLVASRELIFTGISTVAFLSNPRLMRGHVLLAPKRHVERLSELTDEERHELIDIAARVETIILDQLAKGCDLRLHYRPFQKEDGIKVNHLHLHVQPRELFDDLYQKSQKFETALYRPLPLAEQHRFEKLFRDILNM